MERGENAFIVRTLTLVEMGAKALAVAAVDTIMQAVDTLILELIY